MISVLDFGMGVKLGVGLCVWGRDGKFQLFEINVKFQYKDHKIFLKVSYSFTKFQRFLITASFVKEMQKL